MGIMWEREGVALSPHWLNPSSLPHGTNSCSSGFGTKEAPEGGHFPALNSQIPVNLYVLVEKAMICDTATNQIPRNSVLGKFWRKLLQSWCHAPRTIPWPWGRGLRWDPALSNTSVLIIPALEKDRDKGNLSLWRHRELQDTVTLWEGSTGILGYCGIKGSRMNCHYKTPTPNWHHSKNVYFLNQNNSKLHKFIFILEKN